MVGTLVAWERVESSRVVYRPVWKNKEAQDEGEKPRFVRCGVRVDMACGDMWFLSDKTGLWSRAYLGKELPDSVIEPELDVLKRASYTRQEWERLSPALRFNLLCAVDDAEIEAANRNN